MRTILFSILLIIGTQNMNAQELQWTEFKNLNDSLRTEPRPILIFIHTDWCKYCLMQEQTTFKDTSLAESLNENFYCLKLNAESSKNIIFLGREYKGYPNDIHELVVYLNEKGKANTFPTTIILSKNRQITTQHLGLLESKELKTIISNH